MRRQALVCLAAILCLVPVFGSASDLKVPSAYPTIQAAINVAQPGDRVLVAKGVFRGLGNVNLDLQGKAIIVQGSGSLSTVIDCDGMSRGFLFNANETSSTVIRNLTIRKGYATDGGAVQIVNASPSLIRCSFEDSFGMEGGAISIRGGSPAISSCDFKRNHAETAGGALLISGASPTISHCTFDGNQSAVSGGAIATEGASIFVVSSAFRDNISEQGGAAVKALGGDANFVNCTFSANTSNFNGGAADMSADATGLFTNCTFAANLSHAGPGSLRLDQDSTATISNSILWSDGSSEVSGRVNVRYTCIEGGAEGDGNLNDDPKLVDAMKGDLHLRVGSSCIDKGDSRSMVVGQDLDGRNRLIGSAPDMGAFEFPIVRPTAEVTTGADNIFTVPHDGNPETDTALVTVSGKGYDWLLAPLSYQWMIDESVVGTTETFSMEMQPGDKILKLQVRDADGGIESSNVVVKVLPEANAKPVANAGRDLTLTATSGPVHVVIHGHGYDADGDAITYRWSNGVTTPDLTLDLNPGFYTYTLCVTDSYGAQDFSTVHVRVKDGGAPVISINGGANVNQEVFTTWIDPGATATDSVDGPLAVRSFGTVNVSKLGTYTIVYAATDSSGNSSSARRQVKVVDTTPPVITASGQLNMQLECRVGYTEPGATATDNYDGPVSVTTSGAVMSTPGIYTVTYTATDSSGNVATVVRTVNVRDTTPPMMTLNGQKPMTVQCGSGYTEPGASATDACDGTSIPVVITGSVPSQVGSYVITYKATDKAGNTTTMTRIVNVIDTVAPVITLNGSNPMTVDCRVGYTEPGATALDACDGSRPVTITGTVPSTRGTYIVTYTASDTHGNTSTVTRTVNVVSKTPPSANSFNATPTNIGNKGGLKTVKLHYGFNSHCANYTWVITCRSSDPDSGAFAGDVPGDIVKIDTDTWQVRAESRPGQVRTYTFTLTVTDADGNTASYTTTVTTN